MKVLTNSQHKLLLILTDVTESLVARSGKYNKSPICFQLSLSSGFIGPTRYCLSKTQCHWRFSPPNHMSKIIPSHFLHHFSHIILLCCFEYFSICSSVVPSDPQDCLVYVVWNSRRLLNWSSVNFQVPLLISEQQVHYRKSLARSRAAYV